MSKDSSSLERAMRARPTARKRGETTASVSPTIRSTVDLRREVNVQLGARATMDGLRRQDVLAALASAYADGDGRAVAIVSERTEDQD